MYRRTIFFLLGILLFAGNAVAQDLKLRARANLSIGSQYQRLEYNGGTILYSPGGGMGIEVGLSHGIFTNFDLYAALGYQQNLAYQYESMNGVSNRSSFSFNRKSLALGFLHALLFSDSRVRGIEWGAGLNCNLPGTLRITENNNYYGDIRYRSSVGFHIDANLIIQVSDEFALKPGLRYRNLSFEANSFGGRRLSDMEDYLRNLGASGLELSITLTKKIDY